MKFKLVKPILIVLGILSFMFFTNDFGLIDIEKTAIITAIGIDLNDQEYLVTAEISVPESKDSTGENQKALLSGQGSTIGYAIKNMANNSGWFPKLAFCNLIAIGSEVANTNVIKVLDYFSKSLRMQDSAIVVCSKTTAKELLEKSTPLDNVSSFALQKIILKDPGFDRDITAIDIKKFAIGYYSPSKSSFMPEIGFIDVEENISSLEGENEKSNNENKVLFDATTTALFLEGVKKGQLEKEETLVFNMLFSDVVGTTFPVNDVLNNNYLLTILRSDPKVNVIASKEDLTLDISIDLYCKIADQNSDFSTSTYQENMPIPSSIKEKAQEFILSNLNSIIQKEKNTGVDILKIKEKLYKYNFPFYNRYKDNFIDKFCYNLSVNIEGQK